MEERGNIKRYNEKEKVGLINGKRINGNSVRIAETKEMCNWAKQRNRKMHTPTRREAKERHTEIAKELEIER